MSKRVIVILIALGILFFGVVIFFTNRGEAPDSSLKTARQTLYSLQDVAQHNNQADCWTVINNQIYDISDYIVVHPGGEEILRACGVDATQMFTERVDANGKVIGSGTPHSSNAQQELSQYAIGSLN